MRGTNENIEVAGGGGSGVGCQVAERAMGGIKGGAGTERCKC